MHVDVLYFINLIVIEYTYRRELTTKDLPKVYRATYQKNVYLVSEDIRMYLLTKAIHVSKLHT